MRRSSGFTLLEMLVALAVFAVLGLMSSQMVSRVLDVHKVSIARGERLGELQRAMQLMQRDVLEIAPRSVRDEMGDALPVLRIGTDTALDGLKHALLNDDNDFVPHTQLLEKFLGQHLAGRHGFQFPAHVRLRQ